MRTDNRLRRFAHICALALVMCALSACSESEDETPGVPTTPGTGTTENSGEITFSISGGEAITSPEVVQTGDTLDMTISQKSTYKDPDGSVMTCEPKATIRLFASRDTIYVKDLKTLVSLTEKSHNTTQSGTAPVTNRTAQTFDVGGQEIVFDLGYEVYSLTNSLGERVEMPYVKVNRARDGAAVTETRGDAGARASVSVITLKPTARTRMTVTDSAEYEVTVKFNLDIESVNTKSENSETLSFEVNYIGVVEDTRELPDPETLFSHELEVVGGTADAASPFTLTSGRTLSLQWRQSSKYTYFSLDDNGLREVSCEPVASVALSVATDTLWTSDAAVLDKTTATEPEVSSSGESPTLTQGKRTFDIGGQKITAEWSYEAYRGALDDGTEVSLPYLRLGEVRLVDVSMQRLPEVEIPNGWAELYEVTALFSQDIATVGAPEETAQTVEYIVKFIGAVEITLVDVAYRKDFVWEDFNGIDGIEPCTRYILYRDRICSNGQTITDTFISGLCGVEWSGCADKAEGEDWKVESEFEHRHFIGAEEILAFTFNYHNICYSESGYYGFKNIYKTGVDDIELITTRFERDDMPWGKPGERREDYWLMGTDEHFDPDNPIPGWYFHGLSRIVQYNTEYPDYCGLTGTEVIRKYESILKFYDRFLYLDGQIFDFHEYAMEYDYDFHEERATTKEGYPARVFTFNSKGTYLGREYNVTLIDTIYQRPAVAE